MKSSVEVAKESTSY